MLKAEDIFWIRRGFPVQWAGARKKTELGIATKRIVSAGVIIAALILVIVLLLIWGHIHG